MTTTLKATIIIKKEAPENRKYPLQIRITNLKKSGYVPTGWRVQKNDFDESGNLKVVRLRRTMDDLIVKMETEIRKVYGLMSVVPGNDIADYFKKKLKTIQGVAAGEIGIEKLYEGLTIEEVEFSENILTPSDNVDIPGKTSVPVFSVVDALFNKLPPLQDPNRLTAEKINVIREFQTYIDKRNAEGKIGPAANYYTSMNHLKRFVIIQSLEAKLAVAGVGESIKLKEEIERIYTIEPNKLDEVFLTISDVTLNFLNRFEEYLKGVAVRKKVIGKRCLTLTMTNLRSIFNKSMKKYNEKEKDIIPIKHYPFNDYKIVPPVETPDKTTSIKNVRKMASLELTNYRDLLAKDYVFMCMFLAGINACDLYNMKKDNYDGKRLSYNRTKTCITRRDNAFISFTVPGEVKEIMAKYFNKEQDEYLFYFHSRYSSYKEFDRAINKGFEHISKMYKFPHMTTYTFRYTFANILDERLGINDGDIAICLNHASEHKVTEIYTRRRLKKIDRILRMVVDYIFPKDNEGRNKGLKKKGSVVLEDANN